MAYRCQIAKEDIGASMAKPTAFHASSRSSSNLRPIALFTCMTITDETVKVNGLTGKSLLQFPSLSIAC